MPCPNNYFKSLLFWRELTKRCEGVMTFEVLILTPFCLERSSLRKMRF